MKSGQEEKVTLLVNGQKKTMPRQEAITVLEKHYFSDEAIESRTSESAPQVPTEGQWFQVKPLEIDQKLFQKERKDTRQEKTRRLILEAFAELNTNPKYGKNFKTMMPKKIWNYTKVSEFEELAYKLGDHMANWVEQALEWAQRIANGELWEAVCNEADIANWERMVAWKNGYTRLVGGSVYGNNRSPASGVGPNVYNDVSIFDYTVPLVVAYDE